MKIVFCKHLGNQKEYVFKVDESQMFYIESGTMMIAETVKGNSFVIATSDIEECSAFVAKKLSNGWELKNILIVIPKEKELKNPVYETLRLEFERHVNCEPF
jgi:hypothetical protein